jgi:branched-chain amino acid transport system substrate-binding protein
MGRISRHVAMSIAFAFVVASALLVAPSVSSASSSSTVQLGFIGELTGPLGSYGVPYANGAKVAVDQINQGGGFTVNGTHYKFSLKTVDDQSNLASAGADAQGFVNDDGIKFVFGGLAGFGAPELAVTSKAGALYFSSGSVGAVDAGTPAGKGLIVTVPSNQDTFGDIVKAVIGFEPNLKTVSIVGYDDSTDGLLVPAVEQGLKAHGVSIAGPDYYATTATDFSSLLSEVASQHPGLLLSASGSPPQEVQILKENAQLKAAPVSFVFGGGCNVATEAGINGTVIGDPDAGVYLTPPATPTTKAFVNTYVKDTGISYAKAVASPLHGVSWSYDFVKMLALAMKKAGTTTDTAKIDSALHGMTYNGLVGQIHMNNIGVASYKLAFCMLKDGKLTAASY